MVAEVGGGGGGRARRVTIDGAAPNSVTIIISSEFKNAGKKVLPSVMSARGSGMEPAGRPAEAAAAAG